MHNRYVVYLRNALGERIAQPLLKFRSIHWVRRLNGVGLCDVVFNWSDYNPDWYAKDRMVELYRYLGSTIELVQIYFIRALEDRTVDTAGVSDRVITWRCLDLNYLLERRIIDAPAGTAGAVKTGCADDVIYEYVDENLGNSAVVARRYTSLLNLTLQGNNSAGATVKHAANYGRLLHVCQQVADKSAQAGTKVRFNIYPTTSNTYVFDVRAYPWGVDRSVGASGQVNVMARTRGLRNIAYSEDATSEVTYAYVGGSGREGDRVVREMEADALGDSPFNRNEAFYPYTNTADTDILDDHARAKLWENKARVNLTAELVDQPGTRYGVDWEIGDVVSVNYRERVFDVEVYAVEGEWDARDEIITARLRYAEQ